MKTIFKFAFFAASLGAVSSAATLYGIDANDIYTITVSNVGAFSFSAGSAFSGATITGTISDLAEYNGQLYLGTFSNLYKISTSGVVTSVGSYGLGGTNIVALTFDQSGILYGTALGTSGTTNVYKINTTTGAASVKVTTTPSTNINAAGDEEVINGVMYVTTGGDTGGNSSLASINLTTGAFTNLGLIHTGGTDYTDVYGLAVANGNLYGFTGGGVILNFGSTGSITSAVTTVSATGTPGFYGTTDNMVAPEPGTVGIMGLGLVGIGALTRRRRA